jgi:hypothetical protein
LVPPKRASPTIDRIHHCVERDAFNANGRRAVIARLSLIVVFFVFFSDFF